MIFSSIDHENFTAYPAAIRTALDYLKSHDFTTMPAGTYELQGQDIYAKVFDAQTGPLSEHKPEAHEDYIDVQFLATGRERLGFAVDTGAYEIAERHPEDDLLFYKSVDAEGFLESRPGCYCIFFPGDIHRPAVASGEAMTVRKVVVKVKYSLI